MPTAAVEAGNFSTIDSSACTSSHKYKQLKNPFTGAPFAGDRIPTSMFDPAAIKMLQYLPAATNGCGQVTYGIPANNNEYETLGRVDWIINSKHSLFARYFIDDYTLAASFEPTNALVTDNPGNAERAQTITLGDTYTLSPTTLNSAHFTFERRRDNRGPAAQGISPASIGSNVFSQDPNFLELSVSGYFSTYCGTCNHAYFNTNTWSYTDDMTLVRGRHQIMFGVDIIRTQMNSDNNYELDGDYGFTQSLSGDDLADFMLGDLSSYSQSKVQATANRQTDPGLYVQDTFRVNDHFTLTAGVRWEPMLFPQDVFGRGSTFNLSDFLNNVHSVVYPNAPAGMLYYGDPGVPKAFVNDKLWNFAPRLGLVYSPGHSGHDTFRLGGAILYDTTEIFFDERVQSNPPYVDEIDETWPLNSKGLLPTSANGYGTLSNPWIAFPGGNPFPSTKAFFPSSAALYVLMPPNIKPTYISEYNASYQHQFSSDWLAEVNYIGNKTTHIYAGQETNPVVYIPGSTASTQNRRVLSGDFERVILDNITARAHFLVLLTPSALEGCADPADWLRREIETALTSKRNIVPLMLDGFSFGMPRIASQLTGTLATLKRYNGLTMPPEYFIEAMERLRNRFLNVPLTSVLHPASLSAQRAAAEQQMAAGAAPAFREEELTAQRWVERGLAALHIDEQLSFFTETLRLNPDYAEAFVNRANARRAQGDLEGALQDYTAAIR